MNFVSSSVIKKLERPVLTYRDIPYNAALIFNAGVAKYNGRYVMMFRNDYGDYEKQRLDGTNIGLAFSDNGINWDVSDKPCFKLDDEEISRAYDPRLTVIDGVCYVCFAIDTTLAGDTPLDSNICRLGDGVVLSMIDSNSIAPRKLVAYVEDICKKYDIQHQYAVFNKGGTDSGNIHKTNAGVINMTLSIPIRYMHTNSSMISMKDVENCIILLTKLVEEINSEIFDQVSMK